MRLSWPEIRTKAARFADDWKDAHYERGETQTFYNEASLAMGDSVEAILADFPALKVEDIQAAIRLA